MRSKFVEIAAQLAIEAGHRLMELRQTPLIKERKADKSLVTNADRAADQIIRDGLHKHFPSHAVLTEESGLEGNPASEFIWVVDPLDGTKAYARGSKGFSVMIGLLKEGKPYAGVVMDPWDDGLYEAEKGQGAFYTLKGKREVVKVSSRKNWEEMPLITSTDIPLALAEQIKAKLPCRWVPSLNSVGIKVGVLVRQEADLYVNHHAVHYWDTAAPQIVLEEAGGVFTLADGRPLNYDLQKGFRLPSPTLASNGQRHDEFVTIVGGLL